MHPTDDSMKILIVVSLMMPFISALTDLRILSCPEKAILRLNSTANVNCSLTGNFSQVPTMNITKIKDSCGPDTSNYTLTIVRDNGTKILTISFGNIACWATGGDYMITVQMGNITDQQMIEIRIADIPALPDALKVNFTSVPSLFSHLFALEATLPRKHSCEYQLETKYTSTYKMFGCLKETKLMSGRLHCVVVNDTDRVDRDLVCEASNEGKILDVCLMPEIKDCFLLITLQGINKLGSSTQLNVTTPRLKYTVPAMAPRLKCMASSRKLKISWSKPCYHLDYQYRIKFGKVNQSMKYQRTPWITSPYSLTGLTPYTNYQICIEAWSYDSSATKCIICRTDEDVPSKGPTITDTKIIDEGKENPRWDLMIFWKIPSSIFWNGKVYLLIEYKETKTPEKTESGKFNIQTMNSTVKGLYKEREYLIRVVICTIKGCNHSAWINVGFRGAGKSQSGPESVTIAVVAVVSVIVLLFIIVFGAVCWHKKLKQRYGRLEEGPAKADNIQVCHPRPGMLEYDHPQSPSTEYDVWDPSTGRDEDLASTESGPRHGLEAGQLQFRDDFRNANLDETELEQVNVTES